jgi:hypothetical protein
VAITLHSFANNGTDGYNPHGASLAIDKSGSLYGTTELRSNFLRSFHSRDSDTRGAWDADPCTPNLVWFVVPLTLPALMISYCFPATANPAPRAAAESSPRTECMPGRFV